MEDLSEKIEGCVKEIEECMKRIEGWTKIVEKLMKDGERSRKRIEALELENVEIKRRLSQKRHRKSKKNTFCLPPKNYMNVREFADKYRFLSTNGLSHIIKKNEEFFKSFVTQIGLRLYLDPLRVIEYFESDVCSSIRLLNSYTKWKEYNEDLKEISELVKNKGACLLTQAPQNLVCYNEDRTKSHPAAYTDLF